MELRQIWFGSQKKLGKTEEKKTNLASFQRKTAKKPGKQHFSQKFAYFCNFGGKNKSNEKKKHFK